MRELKGDWRDLFNGFMVALDLRKMSLALCGILFTLVFLGAPTIYLGNEIAPDFVQVPRDLVLHKWWNAQKDSWHLIYKGIKVPEPVFEGEGKATRSYMGTKELGGDPKVYVPYSVAFCLVFIAIWSYFGGAIARIAAYEIAKDGERIETRQALKFSRRKFWSFFWAPLICVIGFLFFALCNYVGGLVGKVLDELWIGAPLVAVLMPLAILSGFIMALILVGTLAGFPLFLPAVAAEGTDSFDAVSRGFSYVYSRPWHYLWYQVVTAAYGYVCIAFVILFAILMCHLGLSAGAAGFELCGMWDNDDFKKITNASWAMILSNEHKCEQYKWDATGIVKGPHPYGRLQVLANEIVRVDHVGSEIDGVTKKWHRAAGVIITIYLAGFLGLALGYVISYFVSQQTMIYYVLRKKVDGIEMNEVFEEPEEEGAAAEAAKPAELSAQAPKPEPPAGDKK